MTKAAQKRLVNELKKNEEISELLSQLAEKLNLSEQEVVKRMCA